MGDELAVYGNADKLLATNELRRGCDFAAAFPVADAVMLGISGVG